MVRHPLRPQVGDQFYLKGLWCEFHRELTQRRVKFEVINGQWEGEYDPTSETVYVLFTKETIQVGPILWVGKAPFSDHQYNAAIAWIEEQIE